MAILIPFLAMVAFWPAARPGIPRDGGISRARPALHPVIPLGVYEAAVAGKTGRFGKEKATVKVHTDDIRQASVGELAAARADGGILIDVREPWEWGHVPGAQAPGEPVYVICQRAGKRSQDACAWLRPAGWDARSVAGGTAARGPYGHRPARPGCLKPDAPGQQERKGGHD